MTILDKLDTIEKLHRYIFREKGLKIIRTKRWGPHFLTAFAAFVVGTVPILILLKDSPCLMVTLIIIFSILAIICLVLAIIALFYELSDVCRRNREKKQVDSHKALAESFRRLHPEWTDEQVEIAATGDTGPYLPVDGLDDDGWITPREAYKKSCRKKK